MSKKANLILISIAGIFLAFALTGFIFLASVRGDFTNYLEEKYTDQAFKVGSTRINIIYGNYYAKATCLNDGTSFPIKKKFQTKDIYENYPEYKSHNQYNNKLKGLLAGSDIEIYIKSITGGGKTPYKDDGIYERISIELTDDSPHIPVVKEMLDVLKRNRISAPNIMFTYESNNHVYQIPVSSDDYDLPENEIEARVQILK